MEISIIILYSKWFKLEYQYFHGGPGRIKESNQRIFLKSRDKMAHAI